MNLQATMLLFLFQVIKTLCHVIRKKKTQHSSHRAYNLNSLSTVFLLHIMQNSLCLYTVTLQTLYNFKPAYSHKKTGAKKYTYIKKKIAKFTDLKVEQKLKSNKH